jgi:Domain of unknown function (DUF4136)
MTARNFALLATMVVTSSTLWAQNVSIAIFSPGGFGRDHSFAWSQDSNVALMVIPVLVEEIRSQTREQLENVGLSLVTRDDFQPADVLVRFSCFKPTGSLPSILAIELFDAQSKALLWRGEATHLLNQDDSRASLLIVDRTIAKMFEHFPYHLNGWVSATRR